MTFFTKYKNILENTNIIGLAWIKDNSNFEEMNMWLNLLKKHFLSDFLTKKIPAPNLKRLWQNEWDMEARKETLFKFCKPKVSLRIWFIKLWLGNLQKNRYFRTFHTYFHTPVSCNKGLNDMRLKAMIFFRKVFLSIYFCCGTNKYYCVKKQQILFMVINKTFF